MATRSHPRIRRALKTGASRRRRDRQGHRGRVRHQGRGPGRVAAAAPAAGAAEPEEEQSEFTVNLQSVGESKINVIKAVRELTQLGLKEAKDLVDAAPKPVLENVSKADAEKAVARLREAGASAEMK
jgi:large subunit ribosomal protein L7/L12